VHEVNTLSILELLNFTSGFRAELQRLTGRGAFDTIRAFIIALHISRWDLSSLGLETITIDDVARLAQIPVVEEVEHPTLRGVHTGRRTKLARMVEMIVDVLQGTGKILTGRGYPSLGAFVIECAKRSAVEGKPGVSGGVFVRQVYGMTGLLT
jgi:hypothetical protein